MEQDMINTTPVTNNSNQQSRKGSTIAIIMTIIAVCGIGFGIYGMAQSSQKDRQFSDLKTQPIANCNKCSTTNKIDPTEIESTPKTTNSSNNNSSADDEEVMALIEQIEENVILDNSASIKTFNETLGYLKIPGTDIWVNSEKSYGINYNNQADYNTLKTLLETFFKSNGFIQDNEEGPYTSSLYYNEKSQITCELYGTFSISCIKNDWISEERKQLARELADISGVKLLTLNTNKIVDSSITPYQRLSASGGGSECLFYRTSSNAKWKFITCTQTIINCDKFNDDAKKAYAGEICWDEATNAEKTL